MSLTGANSRLAGMSSKLYYLGPAIAWAGVIFWLSSQSGDSLPKPDIPQADKAAHLAIYLILGLLASRAWAGGRALSWREAAGACVVASLYGLTDEGHQLFVAERSCNWVDWAVDCLGSAAGAFAWPWLAGRRGGGEKFLH